uniref:PKD domain-containing protein n=1 Tax=viral metagenome TaxID=1070528 RepID=A0A6H1Z9E0_9ZZZZ
MKLSDADLALLRNRPHRTKLYLSIFQPATVFAGQVKDDGPQGVPVRGSYLINFKNVTVGSGWNDHTGMTMLVGTALGLSDVGRIRVRATNSDTIDVAENYHIDWKVNQYLTILRYREVWPVFPRIIQNVNNTLTFYKDYDKTYTNQNELLGTIACMGPHRAAYIEDDGYARLWYTTSGTSSLNNYALSYDWAFEGGTPAGSAVANPGFVTYDTPGHYVTSLNITTASGTVDSSYRYVSIYDRPENGTNVPVLKWEMSNLHGSRAEGGYTADITIREPIGDLYDGAVVVIFADDWYTDTKALSIADGYMLAADTSFMLWAGGGKIEVYKNVYIPYPLNKSLGGNAENCSRIIFAGYILKGSIRYSYKDSSVEFSIGNITEVMKQAVCYPITVEDTNEPLDWYELKDMTPRHALYHYLKWHSTVLSLADFRFVGSEYPVQFFDSDRESLFDAVDNFMRDALIGEFVSDRQGTLWAEVSMPAIPNATGTSTPIMEITKQDWMNEPTIEETVIDPLSYLELGGVAYSNDGGITKAITVAAPGQVAGYRGTVESRQGLVFDPAAGTNQPQALTGNIFADRNARYRSINMELAGNYRNLDIAPQEAVTVDIKAGDTNRGKAIKGLYFPGDMDWSWDAKNNLLLPRAGLSKITSGIVGSEIYSAGISTFPRFDPVTGNNADGVTTISCTHTATRQNRLVVIGLGVNSAITDLTVTYGGVAITAIGSSNSLGGRYLYLCYKTQPLTGLQTVTASWTGATNARMIVYTFCGVNQTYILTADASTGTGTSILTSAHGDFEGLCVDFALTYAPGHVLTAGDGQIVRRTEASGLALRLSSSTKVVAQLTNLSWLSDISVDYIHYVVRIHPLVYP